MVKLAENVNCKLISPNESTYVYDSAGMHMNAQKVLSADTTFWDILADAFKYSDEDCNGIAPNRSLKDYFIERLSASQLDKEAQSTVMELAEMWGGFVGDPFERQSLKWFWLEECLEGGMLSMPQCEACSNWTSRESFRVEYAPGHHQSHCRGCVKLWRHPFVNHCSEHRSSA